MSEHLCPRSGKVVYPSRGEAHDVIRHFKNHGRTDRRSLNGGDLGVYPCNACGGYHLGNSYSRKIHAQEKQRRERHGRRHETMSGRRIDCDTD